MSWSNGRESLKDSVLLTTSLYITKKYDLELECLREYDVAVTAGWSQNSENAEAPRDASNHCKVLTGQGKKRKSIGILLIG